MKKKIMLITILFLTIGFAAVTTTLVINVNSTIGTNTDDFDVYFSGAVLDSKDESDKIISDDKLSINYKTKDLSKIGDTSILEYEVTNASKNYDANVEITCTGAGDLVTITQTPHNQIIEATTIGTGIVTIALNKIVVEEQTLEFTCVLNVSAIERESLGNDNINLSHTFALIGKYVDEEGVAVSNANLVFYSDTPHYITTDTVGNVYLEGLTRGEHEIYYVNDDLEKIKLMSKEEVKSNAVSDASFSTTANGDIIFTNNSKITNDVIIRSSKYCETLLGRTFEYGYVGSEQEFIVPCDGLYKIELWGAQGGTYDETYIGGKGAYTSGIISLKKENNLYAYVGGAGTSGNPGDGGYNGGANAIIYSYYTNSAGGGGGATDIRLANGSWNDFNSLMSRIMIAAGGGGYYGGGASSHAIDGGGGGSSFISGHEGCDAIDETSTTSSIVHTGQAKHYSGYAFTDTVMIDGKGYYWTTKKGEYVGMPTHDGTSTMSGNLGNGYAKITLLSID